MLDTFVATGMSKLTAADVPDKQDAHPQAKYRLANYTLNCLLRGRPASPAFEHGFLLMRRVVVAFEEHESARRSTVEYLGCIPAADMSRIAPYFQALHHWEAYLAASAEAFNAYRRLAGGVNLYERRDGSPLQRLHELYNSSKHADSRISAGQMPDVGTLAVWLTNDGLKSSDCLLTYAETGEILDELEKRSYIIEDPRSARERLAEVRAAEL